MKYIRHNKAKNTVSVCEADSGGKQVIPVVPPHEVDLWRNPLAYVIYTEVLYPAVEAQDKRKGVSGVTYKLVPPDPWLIALGMVMWEGIVQGLSWDVVKLLARKALSVMQAEGVAPDLSYEKNKNKKLTELGFCWTAYKDGKKQYDMFVGLRRVHKAQTAKHYQTKEKDVLRNKRSKQRIKSKSN